MSSIPVYVGLWRDYTQDSIFGNTVTLNVRWGGYLIAALSTFVAIVGTALWTTTAFVAHQLLSGQAEKDGVFFQHQCDISQ
jgi:hypothetical protein